MRAEYDHELSLLTFKNLTQMATAQSYLSCIHKTSPETPDASPDGPLALSPALNSTSPHWTLAVPLGMTGINRLDEVAHV